MEEVEPKMYWRFTIPKSKKCWLCFLTTTIKLMITYDHRSKRPMCVVCTFLGFIIFILFTEGFFYRFY